MKGDVDENKVRKRKSGKKSKDKEEDKQKQGKDGASGGQTRVERGWCRSCLTWFKYLILLLLIPPFLNYAAIQQERRQLQPLIGELYDIGWGQKLYLGCMGTGSPTVILDAPTGMSSDIWALVQPQIAKLTKVCVYDRAGLGYSDPAVRNVTEEEDKDKEQELEFQKNRWVPSTVERMADDLHRLVTFSSQQERPLILVGAEVGALVARFYTQIYESDVSDLVLLDPLVEDLFDHDSSIWSHFWFSRIVPSFQAMQLFASLGLMRIGLMTGLVEVPLVTDNMPQNVTLRQKYLMCNPRHLSSAVDEFYFINESMSQMRTVLMLKAFPTNVSVTVINGNYYDQELPSAYNKAWAKSQQHLLSRLLPASNHLVVNGADRHMIYRQPDAVVEPLKRIVRQHRNRRKRSQAS